MNTKAKHSDSFPFGVHKGKRMIDVPAWWIKETWERGQYPAVSAYYERYWVEIESETFKHFNRDLIVYFDGCCEPVNPYGQMGWGFYVEENGKWIHHSSGREQAGRQNSANTAEYIALCDALSWLLDNRFSDHNILVRGDSSLVVNQMNRVWGFGANGLYLPYGLECKKMFNAFSNIEIEWIPREMNEECDYLSKMSLI
jgi:ribonuclease HI